MELITDLKPLLFFVAPTHFDATIINEMDRLFRRLWATGERYGVVTVPNPAGYSISPRERKLVGEWASQKYVQETSKRVCVGSAVVSASMFERGALTAILWLWRPPYPLGYYADRESAIESVLGHLTSAGVSLPGSLPEFKAAALELLDKRVGRAS